MLVRLVERQHRRHRRVIAVEAEVLVVHRVKRHLEDVIVNAHAQQVARGFTGKAATEAILGIEWIANKVGDATHCAP